jgi:hypothetical protein
MTAFGHGTLSCQYIHCKGHNHTECDVHQTTEMGTKEIFSWMKIQTPYRQEDGVHDAKNLGGIFAQALNFYLPLLEKG